MHTLETSRTEGKGSPPRLLKAFVIQLLLLIPWLPFAALSGMAYDQGKLWPAVLFVGPFQAYPLLIVCFIGAAAVLKSFEKYRAAGVVAWLAPEISLGSLALAFVVAPHI